MKKNLFISLLIFAFHVGNAQNPSDGAIKEKKVLVLQNLRVSTNIFFGGGQFIGLGYGYALRMNHFQPGANFSINARLGKNNLGNRGVFKTNWQVNTIISPLFTFNLAGNKRGYYEEISPAYFGVVSGINSNYRSSITIGSSFIVMPRGIEKNIETSRNRTQQLFFTQVKIGWKWSNTKSMDSLGSLQINLYEDFLGTDNALLQGFADNFDRFFTGGGNAQLRINNKFKLKLYSEVYTGTNYRDSFDYPDWVDSLKAGVHNTWGRKKIRRNARYVYQDKGQQSYNKGRSFFVFEYSPTPINYQAINLKPNVINYQLMFGWQQPASMRSQNLIHSTISRIDKVLQDYNEPNVLITSKKKQDRLHFFYPTTTKPKILFGFGTSLSTN